MILCGFDLETPQEVKEYGLQPWRAKTGEATIKSFAAWSEDGGKIKCARRMPSKETLRKFLQYVSEKEYTLVGWNVVFDVAWLCAIGLTDEVKQCMWLDGMLALKRVDGWKAKQFGGVGYGLKEEVKQVWPQFAGYGIDATKVPETEEEWKHLLVYNMRDSKFTVKLTRMYLSTMTTDERRGLLIECHGIPDVALSAITGITLNLKALKPFEEDVRARAAIATLNSAGIEMATMRSPAKLRKLVFDDWGYTPIKTSASGNPSTDKESLLKLSIEHPEDLRFGALMAMRKCNTQSSKFIGGVRKSAEYNKEPITYPSPFMSGTYCVPGDVEVLTKEGWVRLDVWQGGVIAQVDDKLQIEFLHADKVDGGLVDGMVSVNHPGMQCDFTHNHTIPTLSQKYEKWQDKTAGFLLNHRVDVPVSGTAVLNGSLTPPQMRLLCAIQADAWWNISRYRVRFIFQKQRKVDRLAELLKENAIDYNMYVCTKYPERTEITIYKEAIPTWMTPDKKYLGSWLLNTTQEGLRDFVLESEFWDGSPHEDGGFKYTTSIEENAIWMHTAAHLSGLKGRLHKPYKGMQELHISENHIRPIAQIHSRHVEYVSGSVKTYCTSTKTGYWLARSKGTIFITGNSGRFTYSSTQGKGKNICQTGIALHQWERGPNARNLLMAPEGYLLAEFDFSGQEMRLMACESVDETMLELFETGGDGHAYMGASIEGKDYEWVRAKADTDPLAKEVRNMGKFANLSLQYRIGVESLMSRALVQYGLQLWKAKADHIKNTYLRTYKGVPEYWKTAQRKAAVQGYAETRGHRRIKLWDLKRWDQQQTAINFPIQGTGGCMKALAIAVARNYFDADHIYAWDLHDALFTFVKDDGKAEQKVRHMKKVLSNLPYQKAWGWTPAIPLPVDAKLGKTWGTLKGVE